MDLGACKYCGSIIMADYKDGLTDEEKTVIATEVCNCAGAELERYKKSERERAKERIKMLLGKESEKIGFQNTVEDKEVHSLLEDIVDMASDGKINKVSMSLEDDTRIRIAEKDGKISVERVQNIKYKL